MIDEKRLIKYLIECQEKDIECQEKDEDEKEKDFLEDMIWLISEQPQVGGVEIDKNFETILLCAVRYSIGRQTYMPSLVIDYITPLLPYLSDSCLKLIADEIIDHSYDGGLGDDMIDRPYWIEFKKRILLEMERRTSENDTK